VKYAFIKDNLTKYWLQPMLNVLGVAKSGYYAWLKRPKSNQALENEKLEKSIEEIYKESRGNSGSLKVQHGLEARGIKASRPRIARIMKSRARRAIPSQSRHQQRKPKRFKVSRASVRRVFQTARFGDPKFFGISF
jgi:hypothetical protein